MYILTVLFCLHTYNLFWYTHTYVDYIDEDLRACCMYSMCLMDCGHSNDIEHCLSVQPSTDIFMLHLLVVDSELCV